MAPREAIGDGDPGPSVAAAYYCLDPAAAAPYSSLHEARRAVAWGPDKDRIDRKEQGPSFEASVRIFADRFAVSGLERVETAEEPRQTIGLIECVPVI